MIIFAFLYYLFSEDYIENNEMFRKAAESKIIQIHGFILHFTLFVHFE